MKFLHIRRLPHTEMRDVGISKFPRPRRRPRLLFLAGQVSAAMEPRSSRHRARRVFVRPFHHEGVLFPPACP